MRQHTKVGKYVGPSYKANIPLMPVTLNEAPATAPTLVQTDMDMDKTGVIDLFSRDTDTSCGNSIKQNGNYAAVSEEKA